MTPIVTPMVLGVIAFLVGRRGHFGLAAGGLLADGAAVAGTAVAVRLGGLLAGRGDARADATRASRRGGPGSARPGGVGGLLGRLVGGRAAGRDGRGPRSVGGSAHGSGTR